MSVERPAPNDLSALRIHREREPRKPFGALLLFAILAVAIGAGVYVVSTGVFAVKTVDTVTASVVTEGQASTLLSATGYVEADTKADLSPKITSKIVALYVNEGDHVKKGQVLARLDKTDLDAQLADARAAWTNADAELKRQKALLAAGLAPASAVDAAVANEASTRAKVDYVEAQEDYAQIRAPFAGQVIAKRAHVGEAVSPYGAPGQGSANGGAIVTLVDFSTLYVGTDINESNLGRLNPKQPAEITLDAYPDHAYHGHLLQIIPTADRSKGTVKVKVAFEDPDAKILPEMSARVNFTEKPTAGARTKSHVLVPKSALVVRGATTGVWLIADQKAAFRAVRTGPENQGQVEILEGLQGGEKLAADAAAAPLKDGARVKVKGN
jgi:RND family efflux transporter MFP subunit